MTEKIELLREKLKNANNEYTQLSEDDNCDHTIYERIRSVKNLIKLLSYKLGLLEEIKYTEIPENGDKMHIDLFISFVSEGIYSDYDGYGNYCTDNKMSNKRVYPSDIINNRIRNDFNKIIWFNKNI